MSSKKKKQEVYQIGDVVYVEKKEMNGKVVDVVDDVYYVELQNGETRHFLAEELELSNEEFMPEEEESEEEEEL